MGGDFEIGVLIPLYQLCYITYSKIFHKTNHARLYNVKFISKKFYLKQYRQNAKDQNPKSEGHEITFR